MATRESIVYVAGRSWARDDTYRRALALARATDATLAVLSDQDRDGPRPDVIRGALPGNARLAIKALDPRRGVGGGTRDQEQSWLRRLPCSVWLVPQGSGARGRAVVAAVSLAGGEDDALDEEVLRMASAVAVAEGARLVALHAWSVIGEPILSCPVRGLGAARSRRVLMRIRHEHEARMQALVARSGAAATLRMEKGGALSVIRETLRRTAADTLVLGYRARTGVRRGTTSAATAR